MTTKPLNPEQVRERRNPVDRIVADNDPRNGTIAERLIRMVEHPALEPDADGLYPDARKGDADA